MPLHAQNVTGGYDPRTPVLRDVTAAFEPGTLTAIIGPNGAGKTTLLRALLGVLGLSAGRVTLDGCEVRAMPAAGRARSIVYVPQRSSLAFAYSARAVVAMGLYAEGSHADGRPDGRAVTAALERVGLSQAADAPFETLSAGQQQRVTFARALAQLSITRPDAGAGNAPPSRVLLADEPVASMDPRHALATMAELRGLARRGVAVVVAMHDLTSVLRDADRTLVLGSGGTVTAHGPTVEVLTPGVLRGAFGVPFLPVESGGRVVALVPQMENPATP